ncbi:annexin A2 [Genypterus blacodes]|uniref:annexin A2 n=1 Tax=Genypterus blacodes TaxID=154954 RepID=UPI003F76F89E
MDPEYFKSYEMSWGTLGTVRPFPNFHAERDAMEIKTAVEKKDVVTLVRILTNRNNEQRQMIAQTYQNIAGKDLETSLKKALSGDVETLLLALLMTPLQYKAHRLQQAMSGLGTDEQTLLEILCTRSGKQLKEISATFKELYKKDLDKELKAETSGDFAKLLLALLNKESVAAVVQRDIEALSASLNGKKADPEPWINILTSRDTDHLNRVLMGLELQNGEEVLKTVEKKFSGDLELGLKVLVQCIENPDLFLAKRIAAEKTPVLQGIMVSHSEEDLLSIRAAYLKHTGTSLYTALQKQFKGDHLQALLALCRSED